MQNANKRVLIFFLCFSLLLVGCKTKINTVETNIADMEALAFVSSSPSVALPRTCLSSDIKLSVNGDVKLFSAKGTMRIKEGCGVQIGMTALGIVEVASLEFLPEYMRLIYKIGKEYTDIDYSNLSFLKETGIDYTMLESVLMNKAFSPDGRPFLHAMKDMIFSDEDSCIVVTTVPTKGVVYKFYINKTNGELVQSEGIHDGGGRIICHYSDFNNVGNSTFPHTILLTLDGVGDPVSLQFTLGRVNTEEFNFVPRRISSSYNKLDVDQMIKSLGNK